MSHITQFQHLKIQLEAIQSSTNNFSHDNCIGRGGTGKVYKGELVDSSGKSMVALKRLDHSSGQGNSEFWKEILVLLFYRHKNIVSLIGYCDNHGEKIMVYEYASNKSLDYYLNSEDLTWVQRLKICIGAARGLAYIHTPTETQLRIVHRDIKSSNILLDNNWNAKISGFGLSELDPTTREFTFMASIPEGALGYIDPSYHETGVLTKESDVYSFGVVLVEVLCGRLSFDSKDLRPLVGLVREYYEQNKITELVFSSIKDQIHISSLTLFVEIAYQCLKRERKERPFMTQVVSTLERALDAQEKNIKAGVQEADFAFHFSATIKKMSHMEKFQHLKLPLEAIQSATNNFSDDNCIGRGGFGKVYKGEIVPSKGKSMVALKRLNHASRQGGPEFWREISMLPLYAHENIVSLLGYCDDHGEKVLVYEYLSNRSLDCNLASRDLRWAQRLKICVGAARGLAYLHTPAETQLRIVHRDIKSSNVLLDDNWNAKISDFGLSKFAPANNQFSDVVTSPAGTPVYIDPVYQETMVLTKESDVYSFVWYCLKCYVGGYVLATKISGL